LPPVAVQLGCSLFPVHATGLSNSNCHLDVLVLEVGVVVSDGVREGEGFVMEGKVYQSQED
jgi:hypothetical protein